MPAVTALSKAVKVGDAHPQLLRHAFLAEEVMRGIVPIPISAEEDSLLPWAITQNEGSYTP